MNDETVATCDRQNFRKPCAYKDAVRWKGRTLALEVAGCSRAPGRIFDRAHVALPLSIAERGDERLGLAMWFPTHCRARQRAAAARGYDSLSTLNGTVNASPPVQEQHGFPYCRGRRYRDFDQRPGGRAGRARAGGGRRLAGSPPGWRDGATGADHPPGRDRAQWRRDDGGAAQAR